MNQKDELTKKFILVGMDDTKITTEDRNIIGTHALATCVGVLLYNEENKKAIVSHISDDMRDFRYDILKVLTDNNLHDTVSKYKIIPGFYNDNDLIKRVEDFLSDIPLFVPYGDVPINSIMLDENTKSYEFAFDASSGEFVSDKVWFGKEYFDINKQKSS